MENDAPKPKGKPGRPKGRKNSKPAKGKYVDPVSKPIRQVSKKCALIPTETELPLRKRVFAMEYLKHGNATAAALEAGYSKGVAPTKGHRLLEDEGVRKLIKAGLEAKEYRSGITADRIEAEIAAIAFSKPTAVMSWGPGGVILKDSESLGPEDIAIVAEVSETKANEKGGGGQLKLKLHDKMKALELLAKIRGLTVERLQATVQSQDMGTATAEDKAQFQDAIAQARAKWESRR